MKYAFLSITASTSVAPHGSKLPFTAEIAIRNREEEPAIHHVIIGTYKTREEAAIAADVECQRIYDSLLQHLADLDKLPPV